ncbi:arginase family protein, partial [Desulfovibrio desulfuricans]|uniref:arginase family protein n=1 Tax=Desulfovibrio desulfuricans TaxID=876 RepID=UPI0023AEFF77
TGETPQADVSIIGVPFDSGVSYRPGTRFCPAAIREASTLLKPYSPELDVDVNESFTIADLGDIDTIPGYMEDSFAAITSSLKHFFASKTLPVILGG